jgi:hypothetical protein
MARPFRTTVARRRNNPAWVKSLVRQWKMTDRRFKRLEAGDLSVMAPAIDLLYRKTRVPRHRDEVRGQLFDRHLLRISPLYRRSRRLFRETGGKFVPDYMSKVRMLTSPTLIDPDIHYTPYADEIVWVTSSKTFVKAFDPLVLKAMKESITAIYHEQNHRILWHLLPPPGPRRKAFKRYLHFAESIVVALDTACSNELGRSLGLVFNQCGVLVTIGNRTVFEQVPSAAAYRRYLVAHAFSNYLNLELYVPRQVITFVAGQFSDLGQLATHAAEDAIGSLDVDFIRTTCPSWEGQHSDVALQKLRARALDGVPTLTMPEDPSDKALFEHVANRIFALYGI